MKEKYMNEYLGQVGKLVSQLDAAELYTVAGLIYDTWLNGGQVFLCGNGGSASTASHFACDLAKGTVCAGKKRLKVMALTDSLPLLTAWANDSGYENVFCEQLKALVLPGDVVIGISGSGNSANVIKALELADEQGAVTIGLTGFDGGKIKDIVKKCIIIPSNNMQQVEDLHMVLCHMIASYIREEIKNESSIS